MEKKKNNVQSNREWKSSAFTTYFGTPERAAELYCALEQTDTIGPEDVEFATLQGVIPTPEFYVFYNGQTSRPSEEILRLSDSYLEKTGAPMLELQVKVININLSAGHPILQKSRSMFEYAWFVQKIRDFQSAGASRDTAIQKAITCSMEAGIMVDFIKEHGSEVKNMLFTEFNMDDALEVRYAEGHEKGLTEGLERGELLKLIQLVLCKLEKGKSPAMIAKDLDEEMEIIQKICLAAKQCEAGASHEQIYQIIQGENRL